MMISVCLEAGCFDIEADAVVFNNQAHYRLLALEDEAHVGGGSVFEDIGERFLYQTLDRTFES